jgi:hypothetical protein
MGRRGIGWLFCKIVIGEPGAKLGYTLRKSGSEQVLETVVGGRDALADRYSPIAAVPGFRPLKAPIGSHRQASDLPTIPAKYLLPRVSVPPWSAMIAVIPDLLACTRSELLFGRR